MTTKVVGSLVHFLLDIHNKQMKFILVTAASRTIFLLTSGFRVWDSGFGVWDSGV